MKKTVLIGFISCLIFSCNQTPKDKTMLLDYEYNNLKSSILDTLKVRKDSLMLGFTFGWSDLKVKSHIDSLIKVGKLRDKESVTVPIGDKKYEVSGYGYDLYLGSNKHNSLLTPTLENGKLVKLELVIFSGVDNIMEQDFISLYNSKYGDFVRKQPNMGSEVHYWLKQNLEISAEYFITQSMMMVAYKDLIYERDKNRKEQSERMIQDSLNKEKSNTAVKDI